MNIVGVTACTVGIAHTYIAQKKIETAAKKAHSRDGKVRIALRSAS
nr:hypothetical protein [Klebsiella pneumoniae]